MVVDEIRLAKIQFNWVCKNVVQKRYMARLDQYSATSLSVFQSFSPSILQLYPVKNTPIPMPEQQ